MTPRRPLLSADVDQSVQKSAGRDDERSTRQSASPSSVDRPTTRPPSIENLPGSLEDPLNIGLLPNYVRRPSAEYSFLSACARGDHTAGPDFDSAA